MVILYAKDIAKNFDDYFPCNRKKNKCKLYIIYETKPSIEGRSNYLRII